MKKRTFTCQLGFSHYMYIIYLAQMNRGGFSLLSTKQKKIYFYLYSLNNNKYSNVINNKNETAISKAIKQGNNAIEKALGKSLLTHFYYKCSTTSTVAKILTITITFSFINSLPFGFKYFELSGTAIKGTHIHLHNLESRVYPTCFFYLLFTCYKISLFCIESVQPNKVAF